jgi:hypothetical protein
MPRWRSESEVGLPQAKCNGHSPQSLSEERRSTSEEGEMELAETNSLISCIEVDGFRQRK